MVREIEAALWTLMWRIIFAGIFLVLRLFWLPILVVGVAYFVVIPVLLVVAQFLSQLLQPAAAIAVAMLVLWMWRR